MKIRKKRIVMVVENYFPSDTRVRNEAQTLRQNYEITVIALRRNSEQFKDSWNGIRIFRVPELRLPELGRRFGFLHRLSKKISYIVYYFYFTLVAALVFSVTNVRSRYDILHINNPPDTLFVLGIVAKMFGMKMVYDHHDLAPELFVTRFAHQGLTYKLLVAFEGFCCKLADVVITTNESYKQIDVERHRMDPAKAYIVRNDPLIEEWQQEQNGSTKNEGNCVRLLYVGCINPQDGVDFLIRSLHYLVSKLNCRQFTCSIVGDGDSLAEIERMAVELHLNGMLEFPGYIHDRAKLMEYFRNCDICVEPAPDNPLNRHSTFIKVLEYMAAGKPMVAFDLTETRYSTNGSARLVPPGDVKAYAEALKELIDDPVMRNTLGHKGIDRIRHQLNWGLASATLNRAYAALFDRHV